MLEPGKLLGPFRIEQIIGSGAMGSVYRAVYTETGQLVAIKWIAMNLAGNETALARFEREAEILKQLKHPNIVRLFASGHYKKMPFFAMEYVRGESLDKMLERRGRISWEEVVRFGKQLCAALQHSHEKGIIHRDLKPSNLMILKDGTLKLTDFGIAKDVDVTALTGANVTVGTAAYMSPEQCHGERNLTAKSDLYSLGIVLYELLTGEKPFKKETPVEMFLAHVNDPFERPSRLAMEIPPWLDTLVCHLMEKKPEHRPFDAAMVLKILNEVEEKVAEQRSAGLDAISTGGALRPISPDQVDREAARQLRGKPKKKKPKSRTKHFNDNRWIGGAVASIFVVALVALGWWWTRPPTAEVLFEKANAALKAGNKETARDIIQQFIDAYPKLTDSNAMQIRSWHEELTVDQDERAMHNRFRRSITADGDAQKIVYAALHSEDDGDIADARIRWQSLQSKFDNSDDPADRAWVWLAKRKIKTIDSLKTVEDRLTEIWQKPNRVPGSDAERRSAEALRFERFGDLPSAMIRWSKVRDEFIKEFDQRVFVVLAASKARVLRPQVVTGDEKIRAFQIQLIQQRLAEAEQFLKELAKQANPAPATVREVTSRCRDIVDLYGKEPDPAFDPFVQMAHAKLKELKQ